MCIKLLKQIIRKYKYPYEEHTVTTKDGYILELHRIPHGKRNSGISNKPVALLVHGLLGSSDLWVNLGPRKSLGYILADNGYDVWMANHRGTTWSRKHITLDHRRDGKQFWDFSYHELGVYDNTAIIDYVLNSTSQAKLFYIGHSQGTTSYFVSTSVLPEYNDKIRLMIALAPVTYTKGLKSPLVKAIIPFRKQILKFMEKRQMYGILKHSKLVQFTGQLFCNNNSPTQSVCEFLMSLISGFNKHQSDKSIIPVIGSSLPAGASLKQFSHFFQGLKGGFKYYDYGIAANLKHYGQPTAPSYNLKHISSPVAIYYGKNDYLATVENVLSTSKALPNVVMTKEVGGFNHLDFLFARDVVTLLYNDMLKLMRQY